MIKDTINNDYLHDKHAGEQELIEHSLPLIIIGHLGNAIVEMQDVSSIHSTGGTLRYQVHYSRSRDRSQYLDHHVYPSSHERYLSVHHQRQRNLEYFMHSFR